MATKAAPIPPTGLRLERKGPNTRRRIRSPGKPDSRSARSSTGARRLSNWPTNRLLISYSGLIATWISASEVLTHTSGRGRPAGGRERATWAKSSSRRQRLRAFTSRVRSTLATLRSPYTLMPWLSTNRSTSASRGPSASSWPTAQPTCRSGMGQPWASRSSRGLLLLVRAINRSPRRCRRRNRAWPRLPEAPVIATVRAPGAGGGLMGSEAAAIDYGLGERCRQHRTGRSGCLN